MATPETPRPEDTAREGTETPHSPGVEARPQRRTFMDRLKSPLRALGARMARRIADAALRDLPSPGASAGEAAEAAAERRGETAQKRVGVLHDVTERLRGVADAYVAAKLDEIEARVDAKLDGIERRIDQKILGLHEQLRALRDQELRHRLRLLKLTLLFSVLVAVLSLGYKWIVQQWLN